MASSDADRHDEEENHATAGSEEEDTGAQIAPIIRLEEVAVTTGEEDEDALLDLKAKLYRFDKEGNQWKERGTGSVKLLKHKETKKVRLVMRQAKTLKICANHYVFPAFKVQEHAGNEKSCVWHAPDFSDGEVKEEMFCIRFGSVESKGKRRSRLETLIKYISRKASAPKGKRKRQSRLETLTKYISREDSAPKGKRKRQSRLETLTKYISKEDSAPKGTGSDPCPRLDAPTHRKKSSRQHHKRKHSLSPPCESSQGYKHRRYHFDKARSPERYSSKGHSSRLSEPVPIIRSSGYCAGGVTNTSVQTTTAPLPHQSERTAADQSNSPYRAEHLRTPIIKPLNPDCLNKAVEYAVTSTRWMTTAEQSIRILTEKYEMARERIERDRGQLRHLQNTCDNEQRERRKLSESLDNQCRKLTEAEKKAKDAAKDRQMLVDEMDKLLAEREEHMAAAASSQSEIQLLRQQIKILEEGKTSQGNKVIELEAEQARLLDENLSLKYILSKKEELIVGTSDSIDALLYDIWKNNGLGKWSEDYNDWMHMISKHSIREGRHKARSVGQPFDKQQHLAKTFNEEELAAIQAGADPDETESDFSEEGSKLTSSTWSSGDSLDKAKEDDRGDKFRKTALITKPLEDLPELPSIEQETGDLLGQISSSPLKDLEGTSEQPASSPKEIQITQDQALAGEASGEGQCDK